MELVEYSSYKEFKAETDRVMTNLKRAMGETAIGFVEMGYQLKVARDTQVLQQSGYTSLTAFAAAEYDLDKSWVSRLIGINNKFSENGYSKKLRPQYEGFGVAKLTLMLSLPDELNEVLTPDLSKADVQAIKAEVDEEKKVSDIELYLEQQQEPQEQEKTLLGKAVKIILHDDPELYGEIHHIIHTDHRAKDLAEAFAPAGTKVDFARVLGVGRLAVSFKGSDRDIEIVNVRSGEKEIAGWTSLEDILARLMPDDDVNISWRKVYGEAYPAKEKVAPVQPNRGKVNMPDMPAKEKITKEKTTKEKSKVTRAITERPRPPRKEELVPEKPLLHDIEPTIPVPDPVPEPENQKELVREPETEEQITGQDSIENHEEWMPMPVEDTEKSQEERQLNEKNEILNMLYEVLQLVKNDDKQAALIRAEEVTRLIGVWDCEKHHTD